MNLRSLGVLTFIALNESIAPRTMCIINLQDSAGELIQPARSRTAAASLVSTTGSTFASAMTETCRYLGSRELSDVLPLHFRVN